ncbi:MAG: hypothetical protein Q8O19_04970, partial [Rectinemataceae bacterium]|nr:hypothetical protein [Rectinemataceae bacterium]
DFPGFHVESSLGSHFFHNVTSMNIGYLTVPSNESGVFVDWKWLASLPRSRQTVHCNWARLDRPLDILMDGRNGRSAVLKPGIAPASTSTGPDSIKCAAASCD